MNLSFAPSSCRSSRVYKAFAWPDQLSAQGREPRVGRVHARPELAARLLRLHSKNDFVEFFIMRSERKLEFGMHRVRPPAVLGASVRIASSDATRASCTASAAAARSCSDKVLAKIEVGV